MAMLTETVSCRFGETYSRLPLASSVDLRLRTVKLPYSKYSLGANVVRVVRVGTPRPTCTDGKESRQSESPPARRTGFAAAPREGRGRDARLQGGDAEGPAGLGQDRENLQGKLPALLRRTARGSSTRRVSALTVEGCDRDGLASDREGGHGEEGQVQGGRQDLQRASLRQCLRLCLIHRACCFRRVNTPHACRKGAGSTTKRKYCASATS